MNEFTCFVLCLCGLVGLSESITYCTPNITLNELPGGIKGELLSILVNGTKFKFSRCPNTPIPSEAVKFWLFNRENPHIPVHLDPKNPIQVDPDKRTILVIHGWLCNVTDGEIPTLIAAYLQRYDCNVIGVDWSQLSIEPVGSALCNGPKVGEKVAEFLCTLKTVLKIKPETLHVLGHSLGAQIAGFAGQIIKKLCDAKLMRITGLDPASPYSGKPIDQRLDKTDASYVDVIHTNMGFLGYFGSCGHKDYYPNCGTIQPGCIGKITNVKQLLNLPVSHIICDHLRANVYMAESVNSDGFRAVSCKKCPGLPYVGPCIPDFFPSDSVMGENSTWNGPDGNYFLTTNKCSPYARG